MHTPISSPAVPSEVLSAPAFRSPTPRSARLVPLRHLEHVLGPVAGEPGVYEGVQSTCLCSLPDGGALYLTRCGSLATVHPTTEGSDLVSVRPYVGSPEQMWNSLGDHFPGLRPGEGMPRFLLTVEYVPYGEIWLWGIMDLVRVDVVERGTRRTEMIRRIETANENPTAYLGALERSARLERTGFGKRP